MIRKGSTIAYKTFINGKKVCGIGKVLEINKQADTLRVIDCWQVYTCYIMDCENTCNW